MTDRLEEHELLRRLPRPDKLLEVAISHITPPMTRVVTFKASAVKVIGRFFIWFYAAFSFIAQVLWDRLRRRDTLERRAVRMRTTLEKSGGTFVKIGQQLSMRVDLLQYPYCAELSKMLDRMPAFPTDQAIRAIERVTGQKLAETFSAFDPNPIGSASIACVYQATLRNGKKVAVKVRRPGIGETFVADFKALDWTCAVLEFTTILRPGFTHSLRQQVREALTEELDFRSEARYQELFRRRAKEVKTEFLMAPKIHHKLSGEDVIVMEFVSGVPLGEVLAAVEHHDEKALAALRELKIKPRKVATRLLWANHAAMISDLFFHSDPSPGNVFVQPGSNLMFVDFGSCGAFSQSQRRALKEINYHQLRADPEGMARASIAMMEPLPPIDTNAFARELEASYRLSVYAMKSKHSEWWERTSATQWLAFMKAAMKFKVPLPAGALHMIRATLLYDTLAARLNRKMIFYDEYRRYEKFAAKRARKQVKKKIRRNLEHGLDDRYYLRFQQMTESGNRLMFRLQHFLDTPSLRFADMVKKGVFAVTTVIKAALSVIGITGVATLAVTGVKLLEDETINIAEILERVMSNGWYQLVIALTLLLNLRRIMVRLGDKDV